MTNLAQVALCTTDISQTARIFTEVFDFRSAGGRPRWGADAARIQQLPTGDSTYLMMWWLVGRQNLVQLELFHHTSPAQKRRSAQWRPSDIGWARFGITVADFDLALRGLGLLGIQTLTDPIDVDGRRRVCFREPGADAIVEIIEQPESRREAEGVRAGEPAVAYATVSVSDLANARRYFGDAFGLTEVAADTAHLPEHEAMWGLAEAQRSCAVFQAGDVLLEVVQYHSPRPNVPAADSLLSDQGIMNIALGYRDRDELTSALNAALALGATATTEAPQRSGGVYLRIVDGISVELLLVPSELDAAYGFEPLAPGAPGNY